MNENFLNSYAFEQMAKEYNQKYGSEKATILNKKEDEKLILKVTNTFDKVFHLFYLLKVGFKKNGRFKDFFIEVCCLEKELQDFYKDCFEIDFKEKDLLNKENFVNHKLCANEMIEVFLFCIEIQRYLNKEILKGSCNKDYIYKNNVEYIYNRLDEILEKIVRTLKYFYELI